MPPQPQLLDEIIGCIFSHLHPQKLGPYQVDNDDYKALKTCTLVSRQIAFWARRGLYKRIAIQEPADVTRYLSLCRRYSDMPTHPRILDIRLFERAWPQGATTTERGFSNLASLLALLEEKGSVERCHFLFIKPWDLLNTKIQSAILRFLLSRSFEMAELGGICTCFPLAHIPLPWVAKRFQLTKMDIVLAKTDGVYHVSCPNWENEKKRRGVRQGMERKLKKELEGICTKAAKTLDAAGVFHPDKTRLESLWLPAITVPAFQLALTQPELGACINHLRELQFSQVDDQSIHYVEYLFNACKDTLESLCLQSIQVQSATSSRLSALTSIPLPRLHTINISTNVEPSGLTMKSLAWYLLHLKKNQKITGISLRNLNLIFVDPNPSSDEPLSMVGAFDNFGLINKVSQLAKFFKLDQVITNLLTPAPNPGNVKLWLMLAQYPGALSEMFVKTALQREFPNLYRENRITAAVGEFDEGFTIANTLSIVPEGPALTRYQISEMEKQKQKKKNRR